VIVKEYSGIRVENDLSIELIPEEKSPGLRTAPAIYFIEILREDPVQAPQLPPKSRLLSVNKATSLITEAQSLMEQGSYAGALDHFHEALQAAPLSSLKIRALAKIAEISKPESLTYLTPYCRDTEPVLWNYRPPSEELQNAAFRAFLAISAEVAREDKPKALRMLKFALRRNGEGELRDEVAKRLADLGVQVADERNP
jgi:hypothetical protein